MKKYIAIVLATLVSVGVAGCLADPSSNNLVKTQQMQKAKEAANSIKFTDNAEIDNIKKRIELTAQPGLLGFILLLNQAGQPIMYEGVVGKVTSGMKRLTAPEMEWNTCCEGSNPLGPAPSDEGTWGSSGDYIFWWNQQGQYRQWSGDYLYSDKPFRLTVEPLVVNIQGTSAEKK